MKKQQMIWLLMATAVTFLARYSQTSAAPTAVTYYVCDCDTDADSNCVAGNDSNLV